MSNLGMGVTIAHRAAPAFPNILTYLWAKSYGHFCLKNYTWMKSAKIFLRSTYFYVPTQGRNQPNIYGAKNFRVGQNVWL